MRDRAWRRNQTEVILKRRMKYKCTIWYYVYDANGNRVPGHLWLDIIGTIEHFKFKTMANPYWDKFKFKYGKKGRKYRSYGGTEECRVKDKMRFIKMLDVEYGLKRINTR